MALDQAAFGASPQYPQRGARGRFRFLTFPFRVFYRLVKLLVAGIIRTLAFHPVSSLLVVVLLGLVALLGYDDVAAGKLRLSGFGSAASTDRALPPSPAAEDFVKGQMTYDAALLWDSFSDDMKQQLSNQGTNQQSIQRELDRRKRTGTRIDQVQYVGGLQAANGTRLFVYSLVIQGPDRQSSGESHYFLTVDQNDKIIKVE
jgi:hypothetical protein